MLSEAIEREKVNSVLELIRRQKGRFFSIQFINKNGNVRKMVCKMISPYPYKHSKYNDNKHNNQYRVVLDTEKNAIRVINLKTATKIRAGGMEYEFMTFPYSNRILAMEQVNNKTKRLTA